MALTLSAAASMTVAFVVGSEWDRRSPFLGPQYPAAAAQGRAAPVERLDRGPSRNPGEVESSAAAEDRAEDGAQDRAEPRDEIVVAPEPSPTTSRQMRPRHAAHVAVRADPHPPASEDEDATLPATELSD